jgi:hypothetical protein
VTKDQVVKFFGGEKRTAYAMNITSQAVSNWGEKIGSWVEARVIVAGIQFFGVQKTRKVFPDQMRRRSY